MDKREGRRVRDRDEGRNTGMGIWVRGGDGGRARGIGINRWLE